MAPVPQRSFPEWPDYRYAPRAARDHQFRPGGYRETAAAGGSGAQEWRLLVTKITSVNILGIGELIFQETPWVGANLCTASNCTVVASHSTSVNTPQWPAMFDGIKNLATSSEWFGPAGSGDITISFDFGSPKDVRQVIIAPRYTSIYGQEPRNFKVQKKVAGVWTDWLIVQSEPMFHRTEARAYVESGRVTTYTGHWVAAEVRVDSVNAGGFAGFSEVHIWNAASVNQTSGCTLFESSSNFATGWNSPANMIDQTTSTEGFRSGGGGMKFIFTNTPAEIAAWGWRARLGFPTQTPRNFHFRLSPDGWVYFGVNCQDNITSWNSAELKQYTI